MVTSNPKVLRIMRDGWPILATCSALFGISPIGQSLLITKNARAKSIHNFENNEVIESQALRNIQGRLQYSMSGRTSVECSTQRLTKTRSPFECQSEFQSIEKDGISQTNRQNLHRVGLFLGLYGNFLWDIYRGPFTASCHRAVGPQAAFSIDATCCFVVISLLIFIPSVLPD